jgi:orotate phosphoribosyltransferase
MLANDGLVDELVRLGIIKDASERSATAYQFGLSSLSTYPSELRRLVDAAIGHVGQLPESFDAVAATSTATLQFTSLLASRLRLPMAYLRPKPKAHGKQKQIEGQLAAGARVLVVADPEARPDAVASWEGIIREHGAQVRHRLWLAEPGVNPRSGALPNAAECPSSVLIDQTQVSAVLRERHGTASRHTHSAPTRRAVDRLVTRPDFSDARVRARAVAQTLLGIGAVTISRARPFRYASGLLSPIYTDCRLLISYPDAWSTVIAAFRSVLEADLAAGSVDVLIGMATSGIPHASLIADAVDLPLGYVEFDDGAPRLDGGLAKLVEGDRRAVIVEDHITTGGSVIKTAAALREAGFSVNRCVAIFTYDRRQAHANFASQALPLTPLCDLSTLLDQAVESGTIGPDERATVYEWLEDPDRWTAHEERRLAETGVT